MHTPKSNRSAIALAAFFSAVTGYVLFTDVIHGAAITTSHALSLAALVAAIASGHHAWPQLRTGNILAGLMLAVLFLASTVYVVVASGARNGETAQAKIDRATEIHAQRNRELDPMRKAEAMLAEAQAKLPTACRGGEGKDCKGVKATIAVYDAAIRGHKAALKELPPPVTVTGYTHAARVIAALPGVTVNVDALEERLELLMPFLTVLITELGTIVFAHIGCAHAGRVAPSANDNAPSQADTAQTSFPVPPPTNGGQTVIPDDHPVVVALRRAQRPLSNDELAAEMGVTKGEASKRRDEVAGRLDVKRDGKFLRIALVA